jgi:hypothetical protein
MYIGVADTKIKAAILRSVWSKPRRWRVISKGRRRGRCQRPRTAPVARTRLPRGGFAAILRAPPRSPAMKDTSAQTGRHLSQIPGPAKVPDRVLLLIAMLTIDHDGPASAQRISSAAKAG